MPSPEQKLKEIRRLERWRSLRNWCFGLGALAFAIVISAIGGGGIGNPKTASSIFSSFAASGLLHSLVTPFVVFGVGAMIAGAIIAIFLRRKPSE